MANVVEGEYEEFDDAERRTSAQFLNDVDIPGPVLSGPKILYTNSDMVQMSLSRNECRIAHGMLNGILNDLNNGNPETEQLNHFIRRYNRWITMTSEREKGIKLSDTDKEDAAKNILEDLSEAFDLASKQ